MLLKTVEMHGKKRPGGAIPEVNPAEEKGREGAKAEEMGAAEEKEEAAAVMGGGAGKMAKPALESCS